jgi:hypothetical protein
MALYRADKSAYWDDDPPLTILETILLHKGSLLSQYEEVEEEDGVSEKSEEDAAAGDADVLGAAAALG